MTSHYMEEAERADQVVVIDHGKTIAAGTPAQLRASFSHDRVRLRGSDILADALQTAGVVFRTNQGVLEVTVNSKDETLSLLNTYANLIDDFEVLHGTMNDVFLTLTGTSLRED